MTQEKTEERGGTVEIKGYNEKDRTLDIYMKMARATYRFKDVKPRLYDEVKELEKKGKGTEILKLLKKKVGKGTRMDEELKKIADSIEDGEDIRKAITGQDTSQVRETFGPISISCDMLKCLSNTRGQCQANRIQLGGQVCQSYKPKKIK